MKKKYINLCIYIYIFCQIRVKRLSEKSVSLLTWEWERTRCNRTTRETLVVTETKEAAKNKTGLSSSSFVDVRLQTLPVLSCERKRERRRQEASPGKKCSWETTRKERSRDGRPRRAGTGWCGSGLRLRRKRRSWRLRWMKWIVFLSPAS